MLSTLLVVGVVSHLWCAARLVGIAHHSFYSADLMGRDWLSQLPVPLEVNHVEQTTLHSVLDNYCSVFDNELGCMKGIEVELQTKPSAKPRFLKPCSVPYILKQKVEKNYLGWNHISSENL